MHILTVYFYASIAVATRPAVYFASLWSSPRPLISPRIIFPMYSTAALFIRHASIVHSLLINNSCFHVVCYMPEELWLIFLCGGGLDIPPSFFQLERSFSILDAHSSHMPSSAFHFHSSLHHLQALHTYNQQLSEAQIPILWYTPLILPASRSSQSLIAFYNCSSSSLANMPSAEIFSFP